MAWVMDVANMVNQQQQQQRTSNFNVYDPRYHQAITTDRIVSPTSVRGTAASSPSSSSSTHAYIHIQIVHIMHIHFMIFN